MASKGYLESLLNALDADTKKVLVPAFQYVVDNWRLGDGDRASNAQWYKFSSTTAATANDEFSIHHGLNQIPSKLIQVLDLNAVGSKFVGDLTVSRAPDVQRVYLKSASTSAAFLAYLEV